MNGEKSHEEYYGQFVDEELKSEVLRFFGESVLLESKDEHLNDIPLMKWDSLTGFRFNGSQLVSRPQYIRRDIKEKISDAGEGISPAAMVCIYKEAARQVIAELKQ